jgi:hypothetical protein
MLTAEKVRLELHEPYRTLLGDFRHEVGHYYWDRARGWSRFARFSATNDSGIVSSASCPWSFARR